MMEFKKKKRKPKPHEELMARIVAAVREDRRDEAASSLDELLQHHSDRLETHVFAVEAFRQLDRPEEALLEIGVVLALEPEYFAMHAFLAREAMDRGYPAVARAVLDAAWEVRRKDIPKELRERAKDSHYRILESASPPTDADEEA
jgi:predicted Zn-dependent protease